MAKENTEINDIVKKCKILLLDIEGTTTSISFVKETLFPYAEENVKSFLESQWESNDVKEATAALRKQAAEDQEKNIEGLIAIPGEDASKDEQIEGLVNNVKWQMSADRKVGPLKQLQGLIWKLGYDNGDIKGHVYDDVFPALELWCSTEGQKVYIYSSGSVEAQKLLFRKSLAGDILPLIEGHFDTAVGAKQEAASYATIIEKIGCKAEEVLFLTDIVKEAEAARASGLQAALVSREGNAPLPSEASLFPILHSFEQLTLTNKRKTEPQAEEVPAKVPKTDTEDGSKITSGTEVANSVPIDNAMETATKVEKAEEQMEVEEIPVVAMATNKDAIETNKAVEESKTAEVADISEKDVPMDDAVADVPTITDTNQKADSVVNAEVKVDTADNTTVTGKEDSTAKAKSTPVEKIDDYEPESAIKKNVSKTKRKMVDAATITENLAAETQIISKTVGITVDAATSTDKLIPVVTAAKKPKVVDSPVVKASDTVKQPKEVETPLVKATVEVAPVAELTTAETSAKDTKHALATDSKVVEEISSNTLKIEATSITEGKVEANTAVSNTDTTAVLKTMKPPTAEINIVKGITVETSNGTNAKDADKIDSLEAANPQLDEFPAVSVTEPVQNEAKVAAKPHEMTVETIAEGTDQKDVVEAPACENVVEKMEKKTEPSETEKIETEATVSVEKSETVKESKEPSEKIQEDTVNEAILTTIEVKDITDDKESLSEVTDMIDDVVPIIEEPSQLEEMEELQNAGDVLEKECDEILLKVQDVTNMDFIPVKPLHTIAEEMETENMDSNDIVERILDTEMELSIKPEDIDLNTVQEITELKTDTDERIGKVEPGTEKPNETPEVQDVSNEKINVSSDAEIITEKPNKNKVELEIDSGVAKESLLEPIVEKMETEEVVEPVTKIESDKKTEKEESSKPQESKTDTEVPMADELPAGTDKTEANLENKESDSASSTTPALESTENSGSQDATETKVNGKTNGNAVLKLNGNANQDDNLESRLTADAVKEKVNGSNGDSADAENGQGDNKVEAEIPDIKVKMSATDEAHTTKEQPVEA